MMVKTFKTFSLSPPLSLLLLFLGGQYCVQFLKVQLEVGALLANPPLIYLDGSLEYSFIPFFQFTIDFCEMYPNAVLKLFTEWPVLSAFILNRLSPSERDYIEDAFTNGKFYQKCY